MDFPQLFRAFGPDVSNTQAVEGMMYALCGRVMDDPEIFEDMCDKSDKPQFIPFPENYLEMIRVSSQVIHCV